ncbi:MAG: KamA family radical SAM protein [Candidatus Roizmanbacteria bacterium]
MNKDDFIFSLAGLREYLIQQGYEIEKLNLPKTQGPNSFSLLIPKYYVNLINWNNTHDPLKKMVLYNNLENVTKEYELQDPIDDALNSPVPGIIHRHKNRCLLMLISSCAIHCRFCFRKNLLKNNTVHLEQCLNYISTHNEIWEVIFSGGDPFMLADHFLNEVLQRIKKIDHVKMIRFHSRVPVVYPRRISESFISLLNKATPSTIALHINHPREITEEFRSTIKNLRNGNHLLLSQSVLLKDVNDNGETLTSLFTHLLEIGIKPYYLHHLDKTAGTDHFRVSIDDGKKLMLQLREQLSGTCLPTYVIDIPTKGGKISINEFSE